MKGIFSRGARFVREGVKKTGARLAAKVCGPRSYPIFGIPCGLTSGIGRDEGVKNPLYPETTLLMHCPKSVEEELYWRFEAILKGMKIPEEGILTLLEGTATSKGGNLSSKGRLVTTFLQPIDGKPPHQHDLFQFSTKRFFPCIYRANHPVVTLAAGWQGAFYHWVFEVLPRLHLAEKGGYRSAKVYAEASCRFQKESLELLGITSDRMINAHEYTAVRSPQLIVPSIPETPTDWACRFLREKILPKTSEGPPLRLYVSRSDASRRRILNEEAVLSFLKKHGFEKAALSGRSFKEQVELFRSAEAVVGPHGAGFSHLVFCQPTTPVLEIFSPAYFNPCYWHVCDRVGLAYHYLFGVGEHSPDSGTSPLDPDIEVDLNKLAASLKLMGI
jgi:Glycosyltransferase 61